MKKFQWYNLFLSLSIFLVPFYIFRLKVLGIPTNVFEVGVLVLLIASLIQKSKIKNQNGNLKIKIWGNNIFVILLAFFCIAFLMGAAKAGFSLDSLGMIKSYLIIPILFAYLIGGRYKRFFQPEEYVGQIRDDQKQKIEISNLKPKAYSLNPVFFGLYASLLVVSMWAILQKLGIISTLFYQVGDASFNQYLGDNFRAFGPFESPNYLAMYIVPILFLVIGTKSKIKNQKSKLLKGTFFFSLILPLIALVLTKSRAGIIALAISLSLLGLFWLYQKIKSKTLKVALISGSLILYSVFLILLIKYGLRPETDSMRFEIYNYSWQMITENPIFGVGLGNYQNYLSQMPISDSFREIVLPYAYHPHNLFMALWLNLGLLGLLSFVGIIYTVMIIFRHFLRQAGGACDRQNYQNRITYMGFLLVSIIALLIHGIFDTTYFKNDLSVIFWLAVTLLIITNNSLDRPSTGDPSGQ